MKATGIVHLFRGRLDFVSYKNHKLVAGAPEDINRAIGAAAAETARHAMALAISSSRAPPAQVFHARGSRPDIMACAGDCTDIAIYLSLNSRPRPNIKLAGLRKVENGWDALVICSAGLDYIDTTSISELLDPKGPARYMLFSAVNHPIDDKLFISSDIDQDTIEKYYFPLHQKNRIYPPTFTNGGVFIYSVPGAICAGDGFLFNQDRLIINPDVMPHYFDMWIKEGQLLLPHEWGKFLSVKNPTIIISALPCAVIFHPNMVYGHFLLEMLPKILLLACFKSYGAKFNVCASLNLPVWARACLETYFTADEIIFYDPQREQVTAPTMLQPSLMHDRYVWHPMMDVLVNKFIYDAGSPSYGPSVGDTSGRLYLSRSKLPNFPKGAWTWHHLNNEEDVEKVFSDFGFDIVHPQELSVAEQLAMYSKSSMLAGPFSSALHNALFFPRNSRVIGLNRINHVQERIAQLRSQLITFVRPASGLWVNHWEPSSYFEYTIDPIHLRDVLGRFLAWDGQTGMGSSKYEPAARPP